MDTKAIRTELASADLRGVAMSSDMFRTRLDACIDRIEALEKALEPLAVLKLPKYPTGNAGAYSIRHSDIARAMVLLGRDS